MTIHYASHLELARSALRRATECASTGDYDRAVELLREVESEAARSVIGIRQWQEDRMRLEIGIEKWEENRKKLEGER